MSDAPEPESTITLPSRLSMAVLIGLVTGGFSAWYGMSTRMALVEAQLVTIGARIDAVAAASDRVDEAMTGRIDRVIQEYQDHVRSPAHAIGERLVSDLERRVSLLEHRLDDMQRTAEQRIEPHERRTPR